MPELEVIVQMNTLKFIYAKSPEFQAVRDNITDIFNAMYPAGFTRDDVSYYEDSADELALINYTSGTSGFSKGVMIPYRALYSNIEFAIRDAEPQLDSNSKVVAMLPSAHMYGMMFEFLFEMTIGMHVHFLTRIPSPKIIMQAFADIHPRRDHRGPADHREGLQVQAQAHTRPQQAVLQAALPRQGARAQRSATSLSTPSEATSRRSYSEARRSTPRSRASSTR